ISYCRHDSDAADALADTLSKAGLSVWLDRKGIQEGAAFDTQTEEAIAQTSVVIVIWSEHSVKSHWVRAEAAYALGKRKLLPISIDQSEPPLQFMQIQTIDFRYWDRQQPPRISATRRCAGEAIGGFRRFDRRPAPLRIAHVGGLESRRGRASSQDKTEGMDCRGGSSLSGNGRRERVSGLFLRQDLHHRAVRHAARDRDLPGLWRGR